LAFCLLVATKPRTSGGLAALRVPGGKGGSSSVFRGGFGFGFKSSRLRLLVLWVVEASLIIFQHRAVVRTRAPGARLLSLGSCSLRALVMAAEGLELPSVSFSIIRSPLFALLRH
jgi:hypothetical protein